MAFELGLPHQFLGGAVDADGRRLYRVRVATLDGGPVRTSAGYSVLPEHDASILATAQTRRRPRDLRRPAMTDGTLPAELARRPRRRPVARLVSICTGAFVLAAARPPRRAAGHHALDARRPRSAPCSRPCASTPTCSSSTTATSSPRRATPPGIDLLLHLLRRDHGTEVANRVARRSVVAPWREGGQSQFVERPCPSRGDTGTAATRAWALERLGEPLTLADLAAHAAMSVRTFTRRFREETGLSARSAGWRTSASRWPGGCWSPPTSRSSGSPPTAGFGTAASLRQHLHAAIGVAPLAYRRTYRGARSPAADRLETVTASTTVADLRIPADLKPADGRFGCGPSKVRPEQLAALAERARRSWAPRTARSR